jgi:hypothetical protein
VIYPIIYFVYVLFRGHALAVYPYPFINVDTLGYPQVLINASGVLAGFVASALAVLWLDRRR